MERERNKIIYTSGLPKYFHRGKEQLFKKEKQQNVYNLCGVAELGNISAFLWFVSVLLLARGENTLKYVVCEGRLCPSTEKGGLLTRSAPRSMVTRLQVTMMGGGGSRALGFTGGSLLLPSWLQEIPLLDLTAASSLTQSEKADHLGHREP